MKYFSIRDFEKFQHYRDRNPPWTKLYYSMIGQYEFGRLSTAGKLQLILLGSLASQNNNRLPHDSAWLKIQIQTEEEIEFDELFDLGFLCEYEEKETDQWASRYISKDTRKEILERDKNMCKHCKSKENLEIDHIRPISKGGNGDIENLQVLCRSCNRKKRASACVEQDAPQMSSLETEIYKEENIKKKTNTTRARVFKSDDPFRVTAGKLFKLIQKHLPDAKKPNPDKWADTVRLMVEIDKKTLSAIEELFEWASKDDFWKSNILSPTKLREKWDQLESKMLPEKGQNKKEEGVVI